MPYKSAVVALLVSFFSLSFICIKMKLNAQQHCCTSFLIEKILSFLEMLTSHTKPKQCIGFYSMNFQFYLLKKATYLARILDDISTFVEVTFFKIIFYHIFHYFGLKSVGSWNQTYRFVQKTGCDLESY